MIPKALILVAKVRLSIGKKGKKQTQLLEYSLVENSIKFNRLKSYSNLN